MSSKKFVFMTFIVGLIISTLAMLMWMFFYDPPSTFPQSLDVTKAGIDAKNTPAVTSYDDAKSVGKEKPFLTNSNLKSTAFPNKQLVSDALNTSLFGENLRKLLSSNQLIKTDYAMLRIITSCVGFTPPSPAKEQQVIELMASEKKLRPNAARIAIGNATYQQRLASVDRFNELCKNILDGTVLSGEEYKSISASPDVVRWRAIAREANAEKLNLSNLQTKAALEIVVTTPMYGVLEGILYSKLDYSALINTYSEEQIGFLRSLVVPILLCRLGDDCGSDGFLTLQICRNNGICGNDVEGAIWEHLQSRQLNTESLQQFVDQRFRALSVLDFSILKSQK